jgi:glycosyltransferase involved in cell wall biosynthesis
LANDSTTRPASPTPWEALRRQRGLPRVSVVIPTYNRAGLVVRALESALAQSLPGAEVIVVDDGSTDDTPAQIGALGTSVRYVRQQNQGCARARNVGAAMATGEWIAFLDSDDVWTPTHLERVSTAIVATGGRGVLYFANVDWEGRALWSSTGFSISRDHEMVEDGSEWLLRPSHPCLLPASVVRADAFRAVGGFKEGMTVRSDTHLLWRLGIGRPICAVSGVGAVATNDGRANRLTPDSSAPTRAYCDRSIELYSDTLAAKPDLAKPYRSILVKGLARAYVSRAGVDWREQHRLGALSYVGRGLRTDPAGAGRRVWQRVVRGPISVA